MLSLNYYSLKIKTVVSCINSILNYVFYVLRSVCKKYISKQSYTRYMHGVLLKHKNVVVNQLGSEFCTYIFWNTIYFFKTQLTCGKTDIFPQNINIIHPYSKCLFFHSKRWQVGKTQATLLQLCSLEVNGCRCPSAQLCTKTMQPCPQVLHENRTLHRSIIKLQHVWGRVTIL